MLNRKKDAKDGKFSQVVSNTLDMKLRDDLERLKKIRAHRGLRHYHRASSGQRTKTTGRKGRTVGVSKKKGRDAPRGSASSIASSLASRGSVYRMWCAEGRGGYNVYLRTSGALRRRPAHRSDSPRTVASRPGLAGDARSR